jgi:hypothetical protein
MEMKSILQDEKECYECGATRNLQLHHCFFGANRKISEKHGFTVWLCGYHHNQSNDGVHCGNHDLDLRLKQDCQRKYEETHTRNEFRALIGKSYL